MHFFRKQLFLLVMAWKNHDLFHDPQLTSYYHQLHQLTCSKSLYILQLIIRTVLYSSFWIHYPIWKTSITSSRISFSTTVSTIHLSKPNSCFSHTIRSIQFSTNPFVFFLILKGDFSYLNNHKNFLFVRWSCNTFHSVYIFIYLHIFILFHYICRLLLLNGIKTV